MSFQLPPINYLYLVACIMATSLALFSYGRAVSISGKLWICVLLSFSVWTAGEFIANLGTTLAWQLAWQRMVYLGVICGVSSWLLFALYYSGNEHWITRSSLPVLMVVPVSSLLMVATLEWHPLLYREATLVMRGDYQVLQLEYGIGFWLLTISCSYLYTLTGSALLLRSSIRRPGIYRTQSLLIVVAALLPVIPNMLYLFGIDLAGGFDPTSMYFVLSALLITLATQRYHFLSLSPVARDRVFETIPIAVAVCNPQQRITDVNPAFADMIGMPMQDLPGHQLADVLARFSGKVARDPDSGQWSGRLLTQGNQRQFDVSSEIVAGERDEVIGYLVSFNDVTEVQRAMERIARMTSTDRLTSLHNRQGLADWSATSGAQHWELVVVGDIDHFKAINETYGHEFGDRVLAGVANLMRASLRPTDQIARWGGEEFCIVLGSAELSAGREAVERLRKRIENHEFRHGDVSASVTMTFGLVARSPDESLEEAVRRADVCLYKGKDQGRNRVISEDILSND